MLIEQIIEFELRSQGPVDLTCTPTTGNFPIETKIFTENHRVIIIYN